MGGLLDEHELRKIVERVVREVVKDELAKGNSPALIAYQSSKCARLYRERRPLVAANWKMNMSIEKAKRFAVLMRANMPKSKAELLVCPPFYLLTELKRALDGMPISIGGQNVFPEKSGAFTGETSCEMLRDAGCAYAIIGHSERRHIIGESDDMINKKVNFALSSGLKPILCVGELLKERDEKATLRVIKNQLSVDLYRVDPTLAEELVIAYEPVWAIGTGRNATPGQAEEVHAHIRDVLSEIFNYNAASRIRIIYGGSVTPENSAELAKCNNVDGFLVGGASLDAEKFAKIAGAFN